MIDVGDFYEPTIVNKGAWYAPTKLRLLDDSDDENG